MKFFNTRGPVNPNDHYYIAHRLDEQEIQQLIDRKEYIVLHAPRQSGKTTFISSLVERLNKEGRYKAIYVNIDEAKIANDNVDLAMRIILKALRLSAARYFDKSDSLFAIIEKELATVSVISLKDVLSAWSESSEKPIVLFIDEIDALTGDSLVSTLAQLRTGHANRPRYFPQCIGLIGLRDVRDYRIESGSPFNIAVSLTLTNFSREQIKDLYQQHTQETGQKFTDEAITYVLYLTAGQPWLVNALAREACLLEKDNPITKTIIEQAKEVLISKRDLHISQLVKRLREPRVYHIIGAVITGEQTEYELNPDDLQYVVDLGLLNQQKTRFANPIYEEVILREFYSVIKSPLDYYLHYKLPTYKNKDGSFNIHKLLKAFTQFYRENSSVLDEKFVHKESGPHVLLLAYLQRLINGGGSVHREYALGTKRVDIFIEASSHQQRVVIELKIRRSNNTLEEGLNQTAEYMDISNATEGHLIIFDPNAKLLWDEKVHANEYTVGKKNITVWGL